MRTSTLTTVKRSWVLASVAAALAAGALPASASAAVLIEAIPRHLVCGDAITPGIWAQPGTTGSRVVRMRAVDRATGRVWWRKTATARTSGWRNWTLPSGMGGRCRPTTIVYEGPGFTSRFRVRFTSEGV
jgi:hypothetical protein